MKRSRPSLLALEVDRDGMGAARYHSPRLPGSSTASQAQWRRTIELDTPPETLVLLALALPGGQCRRSERRVTCESQDLSCVRPGSRSLTSVHGRVPFRLFFNAAPACPSPPRTPRATSSLIPRLADLARSPYIVPGMGLPTGSSCICGMRSGCSTCAEPYRMLRIDIRVGAHPQHGRLVPLQFRQSLAWILTICVPAELVRVAGCHLLRGGALLRAVPPLLYNWRNENIFPPPLLAYFSYSFRMSAPLPSRHRPAPALYRSPADGSWICRRCECGAIDGMGVSASDTIISASWCGGAAGERAAVEMAEVRRPSRSLRVRPAPRQPHSKLRDPATRRCLRVHATASRFSIRPMRDGAAAQQVWWRAAEGALDEELDTFLLYRVGAVGGARPTPRPSPALRLNLDDDLLQRALRDAKRCWVYEEGAWWGAIWILRRSVRDTKRARAGCANREGRIERAID
ncbi:hypothetical protein B0H10DRAFT_2221745 [Mycena sp. CBHHK59/15]|nr:hypothetical protein B0H10DRAFT_2221745 [Mycena sp. CBHHK59/15]